LQAAGFGRLYSRITKAMNKSSLLITLVTVFVLPVALAQPDTSITIHQEIDFNASPQPLYEALLDANQFTAFSGKPAEINREVGGAFSLFGGHIIGRNVELLPNSRIVQAWRVVTWPEGVYSIAKFELKPHGSGTRLVFDHTGFPEGLHDHLAEGWESNYWMLLKKYLH
jgi:activator of HSP90 ATPase